MDLQGNASASDLVMPTGWRRLTTRVPRHLMIAASAWSSRIVSALAQLVAVRLLLQSLGVNEYAVFALLTGLQGWFLLADLGVGVSTQNHLSEARAGGGDGAAVVFAGRMVAVGLLLTSIGLLLALAPLLAPLLLRPFNFLPDGRKIELFVLTGSLSIAFGLASITYKIWYAEHRGYLSNTVPAAASLAGLLGIVAVQSLPSHFRLGASLLAFIGPTAIIPAAVLLLQLRANFSVRRVEFRRSQATTILKRGLSFWGFACVAALTLQIDYVVLSQFLQAHDIATYSLSTKIFGLAFFVYNAVLMVLWPVFAELTAHRAYNEVHRLLARYLSGGLLYMAACTLLLIWAMPLAIRLLAPAQDLAPPVSLVLLFGLYFMLRVWADTYATLLQSMNRLRPFWILVPVQAALSVGLQWLLSPRFGLHGVVGGLILSFLLTVAWGLPLAVRHYVNDTTPAP